MAIPAWLLLLGGIAVGGLVGTAIVRQRNSARPLDRERDDDDDDYSEDDDDDFDYDPYDDYYSSGYRHSGSDDSASNDPPWPPRDDVPGLLRWFGAVDVEETEDGARGLAFLGRTHVPVRARLVDGPKGFRFAADPPRGELPADLRCSFDPKTGTARVRLGANEALVATDSLLRVLLERWPIDDILTCDIEFVEYELGAAEWRVALEVIPDPPWASDVRSVMESFVASKWRADTPAEFWVVLAQAPNTTDEQSHALMECAEALDGNVEDTKRKTLLQRGHPDDVIRHAEDEGAAIFAEVDHHNLLRFFATASEPARDAWAPRLVAAGMPEEWILDAEFLSSRHHRLLAELTRQRDPAVMEPIVRKFLEDSELFSFDSLCQIVELLPTETAARTLGAWGASLMDDDSAFDDDFAIVPGFINFRESELSAMTKSLERLLLERGATFSPEVKRGLLRAMEVPGYSVTFASGTLTRLPEEMAISLITAGAKSGQLSDEKADELLKKLNPKYRLERFDGTVFVDVGMPDGETE